MAKDLEFIKEETKELGEVFVNINYAIDNVAPFLDESTLNKRKYYLKKSILKKYIDMLSSAELSSSKKSSFMNLFKVNKEETELLNYKNAHREDFTQLKNCSNCACLNCIKDCKFNSCLGCRQNSFIKKCDKEKINLTNHNNWVIDLTNNNTGSSNKYKVLATLQDIKIDKQYIIVQNIMDADDKFILYYNPQISGDEYGEITNSDEFDFVVETFNAKDL